VQDHPAARFAHALAPSVGEDDRPGGAPATGCAGYVEEPGAEHVLRDQAQTDRRVQDHDRRFVRQRPCKIECCPHRARDLHAVDLHDLVVAKAGHMAAEHPAGVVPGTRASGHVDAVERDVPQRQTEEHRGRLVADDGRSAQARQRGLDQEAVPGRDVRRQGAVDVGAAAETAEFPGPDESAQLVVRPAVSDGVTAEMQLGNRRG
jgi:hypothetical protein